MTEPWTAERLVSESLAQELIQIQFPQLRPARAQLIGEGFDNMVYRVNERYVFRFPRRSIAVQLLERECTLLPELGRSSLALDIPLPIFEGTASPEFPWPFVGYGFLNGVPAYTLSLEQRMLSVERLAEFMKSLHRFPLDQAAKLGASYDTIGRFDFPVRLPKTMENRDKAVALGLWEDAAAFNPILENVNRCPLPPQAEALVHGDLHFRNLLADGHGELSSVIDWGDVHMGYRATDLGFVYGFLPPEGRTRFFSIYGEIDEPTRLLSRYRSIHINLFQLIYGHDKEDRPLVEAARQSLLLALEP
jgi:aminoglycoside phosphotransferase (APT) family kinase protein